MNSLLYHQLIGPPLNPKETNINLLENEFYAQKNLPQYQNPKD